MTSMPDALVSLARPHARDIALRQRARLLEAVWADFRSGSRSVVRAMLPPGLLPKIVEEPGFLDAYAVDGSVFPDGIWRVCRDDVGRHPGAALLEAPLLAVLLPTLCRALLGQLLLLPSRPAWWLGDAATLPMLVRQPARYRLCNAFDPHCPEVVLARLSAAERCGLQASFDREPKNYTIVLNLRLQPRRFVLPATPAWTEVKTGH